MSLCNFSKKKTSRYSIWKLETDALTKRVPEEINRKIVDHLSDINMPLTEHARQYLISEGISLIQLLKLDLCMKEILNYYSKYINKSTINENLS